MSDWEIRANHTDGGRAKGGRLRLEGERLVFSRHGVDRGVDQVLGATGDWSAALSEIAEVGKEPRGMNPFNGSLRARLRVVTADGRRELFVVNRVDGAVERIRAAMAANAAS